MGFSLKKTVRKALGKTGSKILGTSIDAITGGTGSKLFLNGDSYLNDLSKSLTGMESFDIAKILGLSYLTNGVGSLLGTGEGGFLSGIGNLLFGNSATGSNGLFSGLTGLLSNIGESVFSAKQAKDLYKWQIEQQEKSNVKMFNLENDANLKMWNMQNAYNTPAQQMLRFKDAGLNPNLIYGQTNTASPIATGNLQGASASYSPEDTIIGRAMALRQQEFGNYVALSNLGMQKTLNDAQAWNIYNTAKNRDREYELEKKRLELQERMQPYYIASIDSQIGQREWQEENSGEGWLGGLIGHANARKVRGWIYDKYHEDYRPGGKHFRPGIKPVR